MSSGNKLKTNVSNGGRETNTKGLLVQGGIVGLAQQHKVQWL